MDPLTLSRFQFGDTAAFHILWPLLSIGLGLYMFLLEAAWLYTKKDSYYYQVRFWAKIFILTFAIGTASGLPLEFEFGTNWAQFSSAAGDFFGNILGFESTIAFALEAAFLGIFAFGWGRVRPWVHLFANGMVAVGATLSAFWIMVANSWMQVPLGVTVQGGKILVTDYMVALFNGESTVSFFHMEIACIEATLFFITGLCAWALLRKNTSDEYKKFFLQAFKFALAVAIIITPLQLWLGDLSGQVVAQTQPEKLAALELNWQGNPPGEGSSLSLLAWPNSAGTGNAYALEVPDGLSVLTTHTSEGYVPGLNNFASNDQPSVTDDVVVFYSFRLMVACGVLMFFVMLWGVFAWLRGHLVFARTGKLRIFWWTWVWSIPLGFLATETGWMVREIGRQPWVVYHLMRTSAGLSSDLSAGAVMTTLGLFTLIYGAFLILFVYFTWRIVQKGPDFISIVPSL
jgi:cytochrome bd ubiquinol oxidase subunit I